MRLPVGRVGVAGTPASQEVGWGSPGWPASQEGLGAAWWIPGGFGTRSGVAGTPDGRPAGRSFEPAGQPGSWRTELSEKNSPKTRYIPNPESNTPTDIAFSKAPIISV